MHTKPLTLALLCCAFLLLPASAWAKKNQPPATPVEIAAVKMMKIAPEVEVAGTVISRDDAQLAAEVEGRVTWIAEVGQYIAKGGTVAEIDDTRLQLQKREAESKVKAARTRIGFLRKESKRLQQMAKNQHTSQTVLEKTLSDFDVSKADLDAAEAQLELIEDNIRKTHILAPFNGYVTERHKMTGEHVKNAEEVVHLVGIENIEIEASAPLMYVRYAKKGEMLTVKNRDQQAKAAISSLVSIGSGRSRQFILRLALQKTEGGMDWIPGMAVRVSIPTRDKVSRMVIPRDAMVIRRDGIYVFRVNADDTVERVQVTTGAAAGGVIAVSGQLKAGDRLVIRGNERLRTGQKITVTTLAP